jgi:two-component system, LytTR family, sensor kinase
VQVLRAQLQPHFLFNTLQGISTLMHRDVALADRMLQRLSELLRRLLEAGGAQQVSVQTELELLDTYLDIEHARLGARLRVEVDVPQAMLSLQVPSMVLQPLVENAIRHGIAQLPDGGLVEIRASRDGAGMRWDISNDGPPASADGSAARGQGIGLDNTRRRLVGLYGAGASLQAGPVPRGWSVRLTIPQGLPQ